MDKVQAMKIISQNVRGMRDVTKRKQLFTYFRNNYDLIFLQEMHSIKEDECEWAMQWGGPIHFAHGSNNSRGVAILIDSKIDAKIDSIVRDSNGRFIIIELDYKNMNYVMCNLYAPNSDDVHFFEHIVQMLNTSDYSNQIIGGDFNLVLNVDLD